MFSGRRLAPAVFFASCPGYRVAATAVGSTPEACCAVEAIHFVPRKADDKEIPA